MRLGYHVSIAGKIYEAIDRAVELDCGCMQIFSRNPRGWKVAALSRTDAEEFQRRRREAYIYPVLVHIPYIINLATPEDRLYKISIASYIEDIKRADMLGAEYFVTHLGSHRGRGERYGLKRFTSALNTVIGEVRPKTTILLESTAGAGASLGYKFEHMAAIIKGVKNKDKIGVCLDTQHIYAAGYDIVKNLNGTISAFDDIIGLDRLKAMHLNDSKSGLGSRVDRHEHIGKGNIGLKAFKKILNHPKLRHLPFIMETPMETRRDDINNMESAKSLCKKEYYEGRVSA
ncbi:MAG: deoxyribonuclease IV [Candidatus Omnitrophica bacterium]|nr:deoxyribonuclease IV [Candidatus Omnitrophota bacterium]